MSSTNEVFRNVHATAQRHLGSLVDALIKTLDQFGAGPGGSRQTFGAEIRKVLLQLATCEEDESPLANVRLEGNVGEKRQALIKEVLLGFGADEHEAERMTRIVLSTDPNILGTVGKSGVRLTRNTRWKNLTFLITQLHGDARRLRDRLKETLEEINRGYRGSPRDPEEGVEQVVELLRRFPDVADIVYQKAGLTGLTSFPPQGGDTYHARLFAREVQEYIDGEWWWDVFKVAGLVVAAIAVTIVTAGTLGPLAATLVGGGIGLVQGGVGVYNASDRLQDTRDAQLYGAASEARVDHAEGELTGAWGLLVVNLATAGAIGRFGGTPAMSALTRMTRVTALSAAGGGLATATNPNVWHAENTGSLILFGTVIGGAAGAGGHVIAGAAGRLVRPLGANIQIGVSKVDGALAKGRTVKVQLGPNDAPVDAKVVSINTRDNTVMLTVEGQNLHVKVGRLAKVDGSMFDEAVQTQGLRPATEADLNPRFTPAYLTRNGQTQSGLVGRAHNGELVFHGADSSGRQPVRVQLSELKVYSEAGHANAAGVPLQDLQGFRPQQNQFQFTPVGGKSGYYAARPYTPDPNRPRLFVVTGAKHDHNGAFNGWQNERLPRFDMRGRGTAPAPDEVALFMAHGAPTGFSGMGTRKAARTMVDAIVSANRSAAGTGQAPIRFCSLSSCSQGTRRFLVMGKTNAQAFQEHVDLRLRELGIDPGGRQGITVLASDRMGSLYGSDAVKVFGKFQTTPFVPAGAQRPLSYGADVGQMSMRVSGFVLAVAGGSGVMVVAIETVRDPEAVMEWITTNTDKVLGVLFETDDAATPIQLSPGN